MQLNSIHLVGFGFGAARDICPNITPLTLTWRTRDLLNHQAKAHREQCPELQKVSLSKRHPCVVSRHPGACNPESSFSSLVSYFESKQLNDWCLARILGLDSVAGPGQATPCSCRMPCRASRCMQAARESFDAETVCVKHERPPTWLVCRSVGRSVAWLVVCQNGGTPRDICRGAFPFDKPSVAR